MNQLRAKKGIVFITGAVVVGIFMILGHRFLTVPQSATPNNVLIQPSVIDENDACSTENIRNMLHDCTPVECYSHQDDKQTATSMTPRSGSKPKLHMTARQDGKSQIVLRIVGLINNKCQVERRANIKMDCMYSKKTRDLMYQAQDLLKDQKKRKDFFSKLSKLSSEECRPAKS